MNYTLAIIIPSWNSEQYISEMLDSIISNTFEDWRCFVVDDCSTDDTQKIVKDYTKRERRISLHIRNREPKGAQTCRNIGFSLASDAKYIIWFDADDIITSYCLKQRVEFMDKNSDLDFAVFPAKTFISNPSEYYPSARIYGIKYGKDSLRDMLKWCLPMVGWTNIYKYSSLKLQQMKWDENLLSMQDTDFNISAMLKGMKYEFAYSFGAKVDYFYRAIQNVQACTSGKIASKEHHYSHIYLLQKILSSLSDEQKRKYRRELECYIFRFANLLRHNKGAYESLLNISWVKEKIHLSYSLRVYRAFQKYYPFTWCKTQICTLFMLNHLQRDYDKYQADWIEFMSVHNKLLNIQITKESCTNQNRHA